MLTIDFSSAKLLILIHIFASLQKKISKVPNIRASTNKVETQYIASPLQIIFLLYNYLTTTLAVALAVRTT